MMRTGDITGECWEKIDQIQKIKTQDKNQKYLRSKQINTLKSYLGKIKNEKGDSIIERIKIIEAGGTKTD